MLRAQQHGATQQQYMPSTPFMASPGFTPGFPQGLPLSSPALPNPLAQQWQFTAPQMSSPPPIPPHMFGQPVTGAASGMFGQPMTGAASGLSGPVPTLSSLDPTQFGATNAAQLEEAKHRLSALEQLRRDWAAMGGASIKPCPMAAPPGSKDRGHLLREVETAAKAHIPHFKRVKTVSELIAACREVLLAIKARWPRVILTESFQHAIYGSDASEIQRGIQPDSAGILFRAR